MILNMYTKDQKQSKSKYTNLYMFKCRGFFPKNAKLFYPWFTFQTCGVSIKHLHEVFIMKTVELQFQGKQYIYLPQTLVEITDL